MANPVVGKRSDVLVLGAIRGAGHLIVREAQARGYNVAALVRSSERADGLIRRPGQRPGVHEGSRQSGQSRLVLLTS